MGLADDVYDITGLCITAKAKENKKFELKVCDRDAGNYFILYVDSFPFEFGSAVDCISFLNTYINS